MSLVCLAIYILNCLADMQNQGVYTTGCIRELIPFLVKHGTWYLKSFKHV